MVEAVLEGKKLYVDIVETNPPFTLWLFMPAVLLAKALGVASEFVVHAYAYAASIVGLAFAALIARRAGFPENPALVALLPVFFALLVLFPGNSFSEREHLGIALLLPLLALMAWRVYPGGASAPGHGIAMLAGLCGSVIVLVKPYYAIVILAPALHGAWRTRTIRPLFATEYWVIGLVCVAYLGAVFRFHPEFLRDVYPDLSATYLRVKLFEPLLLQYGGAYLVLLYLVRSLRTDLPLSPLVLILLIASVAAVGPLVYQAKGWPYHAYPAIVLGIAALLCRIAQLGPPFGLRIAGGARTLLVVTTIAANGLPFLATQKPGGELVASIRAATDRPSVAVIGSDIAAGHPLTRMIGGRWISAYCSDWLGAFAFYLAFVERMQGNTSHAGQYDAMVQRYIDFKIEEFEAAKPDLLLFQKHDQLWTRRLMSRDAFARLMNDYHLLTEDLTIRVYVREGSGR